MNLKFFTFQFLDVPQQNKTKKQKIKSERNIVV